MVAEIESGGGQFSSTMHNSRLGSMDSQNKQRHKYSLNPSLNKRIQSKRIEDPRKQAVLRMKQSLSQLEANGSNRSSTSVGHH